MWAHSRSSSSFSAELKDFIFGDVDLDTCSATTTLLQQRSGADTDPPSATNVGSAALELNVTPGAWVRDTATVTPNTATGNVNFRYYSSVEACDADDAGTAGTNVSSNALALVGTNAQATSATVQFNTVGNFYWRAFYLGGNLDASSSECNEIVHVVQVASVLDTAPWVYPNDKATLSAPSGGAMAGSISFKLYDTALNCDAGGATGLLYTETPPVTVTGAGDYNTTNTSVKVSTDTTVFWRVEFTSTNPAQAGRNSLCQERILTDRDRRLNGRNRPHTVVPRAPACAQREGPGNRRGLRHGAIVVAT